MALSNGVSVGKGAGHHRLTVTMRAGTLPHSLGKPRDIDKVLNPTRPGGTAAIQGNAGQGQSLGSYDGIVAEMW